MPYVIQGQSGEFVELVADYRATTTDKARATQFARYVDAFNVRAAVGPGFRVIEL